MLVIIDGMKGAGKTTTVAALAAALLEHGVSAQTIKPARAESAIHNWVDLVMEARHSTSQVTILDRGLGSEAIFSPLRGRDSAYVEAITETDTLIKDALNHGSHYFPVFEVTLLVNPLDQLKRDRIDWPERPEDTIENWLNWSEGHSDLVLNTSRHSVDEVVQTLLDQVLTIVNDSMAPNERINTSGLDKLLALQERLMRAMDIDVTERLNLVSAAIGMSCEASEVLDMLNTFTRTWVPMEINEAEFLEENVDVLFYLLEIIVLKGWTSRQFTNAYLAKWRKNMKRNALRQDHVEQG